MKMDLKNFLKYFLTLLIKYYYENDGNFPVVQTKCGKVEGSKREVVTDAGKTKSMYEFNNIPYAVPPVGDLRWRPPQRMSRRTSTCWKGLLKYTNNTIRCTQLFGGVGDILGQEDCLFLDIRTLSLNRKAKKPVLVWIHGGAMLWGEKSKTGYSTDSQLAASLDVVAVNINYRLNVFGFLSLEELWIRSGSKESYGNYGIMDQIMALRWIRENIKYFGGDPKQVTIFGQSGGATGVNALLSSTPAQGLFQKAISASGAPNIRVPHTKANVMYRSFITNTNCTRNTPDKIRKCLQALPVDVILKNAPWFQPIIPGVPPILVNLIPYKFYFPSNTPVFGFPIEIIDPVVVQRSPDQIAFTKNNRVDVAFSNTAQEINVLPPIVLTDDFSSLKTALDPRIRSFNGASYDEVLAIYKRDNTENEKVQPPVLTPSYLYNIMSTDVLLSCAMNDLADHLSSNGYNAYRFVISQPPSPINGRVMRAAHEWDARALFGYQQTDKFGLAHIPTADDLVLKANIRKYYKSFVHSDWKFYLFHAGKTAVFWENDIKLYGNAYHHRECKFWRENGFLKHSLGNLGV